MTNLLTLATQIEQATEDQQQDMLIAAWGAMFPFIIGEQASQSARWESGAKFSRMLAAKAYESAAMMLVPENHCIGLIGQTPDNPPYSKWYASLWRDGECDAEPEVEAMTMALALAAACCRAVAQMGEGLAEQDHG